MAVSARRGTPTPTTYDVTGSTLTEINDYISRHGPEDPNESRRYAGSCRCQLVIAIGARDIEVVTEASGRGHTATARVVNGTVTDECIIKVPALANSTLSANAQREWDRFLAATQTHEDGHVESYRELAVEVARELGQLTGSGEGRSARNAERAARQALERDFNTRFTRRALECRINDNARAYDARTRHGATQGAVLNLTIV